MHSDINLTLIGVTNETGDGLPFYVFESVKLSASEPTADNGSLFLKIKKMVIQI